MLVESPLPPRPTSSTAKSAPASLKYTNATAVMTSNSVGESYPIFIIFSTVSRTIAVYFSSSASDIYLPSSCILSLNTSINGEV